MSSQSPLRISVAEGDRRRDSSYQRVSYHRRERSRSCSRSRSRSPVRRRYDRSPRRSPHSPRDRDHVRNRRTSRTPEPRDKYSHKRSLSRSRSRSRSRSPLRPSAPDTSDQRRRLAWIKPAQRSAANTSSVSASTLPTSKPNDVIALLTSSASSSSVSSSTVSTAPADAIFIKTPKLKTVSAAAAAVSNNVGVNASGPNMAAVMIEVVLNDRLGRKLRVKCNSTDSVGILKRLVSAQVGTAADKLRIQRWYQVFKDHVTLDDYEIHDGSSLDLYYM